MQNHFGILPATSFDNDRNTRRGKSPQESIDRDGYHLSATVRVFVPRPLGGEGGSHPAFSPAGARQVRGATRCWCAGPFSLLAPRTPSPDLLRRPPLPQGGEGNSSYERARNPYRNSYARHPQRSWSHSSLFLIGARRRGSAADVAVSLQAHRDDFERLDREAEAVGGGGEGRLFPFQRVAVPG